MLNQIQEDLGKMTTVKVYKDSKDTKLGITFFRRDPQDNAVNNSAIVSRIGANGPASEALHVGERIMYVQGIPVEGPLHAARMLRESEGYLKIMKLPKRVDFDANLEKYMQMEAEAARAAMAAALPGQQPQSTPRTDAATPRGPGAASAQVPSQFSSGLRPLNQGGAPPGLNIPADNGLQTAGAQISARAQQAQADIAQNLGNLSARAGAFFGSLGNKIGNAAEFIPTQANNETRAAKKIQKAWRGYAARGHFHEERGAVLMLQAASRRAKAKKVVEYKKSLKYWAAVVIQERYRRHSLRQKAKALEAGKLAAEAATPKKQGVGAKIVKSLSFSRRKKPPPKPAMPADIEPEDLISARGNGPDRGTMLLGTPKQDAGTPGADAPTGGKQKRSLSFMRRKKAAEAAEPKQQHV